MDKRTARKIGQDRGYDLAINMEFDPRNIGDYEGLEEAFLSAAFEAEVLSRSYSPFEFLARDFNSSRDPDGVWEAYERGVEVGVNKAWRERRKELERKAAEIVREGATA